MKTNSVNQTSFVEIIRVTELVYKIVHLFFLELV